MIDRTQVFALLNFNLDTMDTASVLLVLENRRFARVVDRDTDPSGHPRRLYALRSEPARLILLLVDSTPIPDGQPYTESQATIISRGRRHARYVLEVDALCRPITRHGFGDTPQKRTCHNAVASTFGLTGEDYGPVAES